MTMTPARTAAARRVSALAAVVLLAACATASPAARPGGLATPDPGFLPVTSATAARPTKVLVVVEENHTEAAALARMPYLAALASGYGHTTRYRAVAHPSLPNYLALAAGSTFGVSSDADPGSQPVAGASAFDRALAAGRTAKAYVESMPSNCAVSSTGDYAVKHNAWAYFVDPVPRADCRRFDVPAGSPAAGALRRDVDTGALPTVGLLIPNLCHDGHDCSLGTADRWLQGWLPMVQRGPDYRTGKLAILLTFDEDDNSADNTVLTVVVAPRTRHLVSSLPFSHYSITRYFAELTGTSPEGSAATAASLRAEFRL